MADDHFEPSNAAQHPPHIHRPVPLRNFDTRRNDTADSPTHGFVEETPQSATETGRSSDFLAQLNARLLRTYNARDDEGNEREKEDEDQLPARNKSFLNMAGSTLFGIYDDVGSSAMSTAETPWGTGAETPAHTAMGYHAWDSGMGSPDGGMRMKQQARRGTHNTKLGGGPKTGSPRRSRRQGAIKHGILLGKLIALFLFGVTYGLIVSHLHDTRQLSAVHVRGMDRDSWIYLASWGCFGVALGSLLPYVDLAWGGQHTTNNSAQEKDSEKDSESPISEQINDVVRSVAAFIGVAFAIRRLPWQSTLQLTLTLALVNPALWYILDRSKPGLSCSLIVTSILTSFIFLSNPNVLPSPSLPSTTNATQLPTSTGNISSRPTSEKMQQELFAGVLSYDNLAVVTWVGSVLFCSCVCFGSIGRRLAVLEESGSKR
ncbi:insulin-induced protein-domain-containing protein [Phaeosphaeriaceae sp. PMI808]|nr:insulin-induced protein-domain-containing protein [Phaeosphaeriaceae sp. PMI808]